MDTLRRHSFLLETVFSVNRFLVEAFDERSFLNKLESVMQLVRRGATEGERQAGKMALDRLRARAEEEMKTMSRSEIVSLRNAIMRITSNDKPEEPKPRNNAPPPPPPPSVAMFRMGQWVVISTGEDKGRVGKIAEVRRNRFDDEFSYQVKMSDSNAVEYFNEKFLRAATQEDLDAAVSKRPTTAKFAIGGYVLCTDDSKIGKVVDTGWDRSTNSRWYTIDFLDGSNDMIEERYLREATRNETEYQRRRYKPASSSSSSSSSGGGNDIQAFARYINKAENSNKVYGVVKRDGKYYTFWGGYGKSLSVKQYRDLDEALLVYHTKELKGYKQIPPMGETHTWIDRALNDRFAKL